jgi:centrosomal protein CEP41
MRDKAEYSAWHISEAYNFPLMMLNQDKTFPELHRFKNKEDKLIIVYVSDERNGIQAATSMVDRGYDNTYLLSGGIEKFIEDYPNLIEGNNIPALVDKKPAEPKNARKR